MTLPLFGQLELLFHHPPAAAQQRIEIGARVITYKLVRSRRSTLGLTIDHRGLRVGVPIRASAAEIEQFIRANGDWVLKKLRARHDVGADYRIAVCDGSVIPVLGEACRLRLRQGAQEARWSTGELVLARDASRSPREALLHALKTRAIMVFTERADILAPRLPVDRPRISLSSAQTRWGSCSVSSGVKLNWRLVHVPLNLIDYVVAHELAHLREMNHSARFWSLVERALPAYRAARAELKEYSHQLPCI